MLIGIVVACETGFWVLLGAGLAVRYLLGRRRLGAALLVGVPIVDLVLLTVTVIDLAGGATATFGHGLAAAYLGFSVAFGHRVVRWADERFAHRFAGGPPPPPPRAGWSRVRAEWCDLGRALLAWTIACVLLGSAIAIVDDAARTGALASWIAQLTVIVAIWSLWPITYTVLEAGKVLGRRSARLARPERP